MGNPTFDDFLESDMAEESKTKPLFTVSDIDNDEQVLKWFKEDYEYKRKKSMRRLNSLTEWVALYKGIHFKDHNRSYSDRSHERSHTSRNPKMVINFIYEFTESKVARQNRFKPAIAVLPNNINEYGDEINSKTVKKLITSEWRCQDIDDILRKKERHKFVFGESYLAITWDKHAGPISKAQEKAVKQGKKIPMMSKDGKRIMGEDGKPIMIKEPVRIGEIKYKLYTADRVFPQADVTDWSEVKHVTVVDYIDVEELKMMYPEKAHLIRVDAEGEHFDYELLRKIRNESKIAVHTLWHKDHRFLEGGREIIATKDLILSNEPLPYEDGQIPLIRNTDMDVPGELHARSFISQVRAIQRHFNSLASGVARNHGIASAPKWVMPQGSAKISSLGNDITVVEHKGPIAPKLVSYSPTSPEIFGYMDKLENYSEKMSGVHNISRGTPPPGIKAAIALQFLDEQENERSSDHISKRHKVITRLAELTYNRQNQFYKDSDGRIMKTVGRDNSYQLRQFKKSDIDGKYDFIIQNSSALPEAKSAKIQSLLDLRNGFPTVIKDEIVIDMLDLGAEESFKSAATVAVQAAKSENDMILETKKASDPEEYEDLLIHYAVHVTELQSLTFKSKTDPKRKAALILHTKATEYLMAIRAMKNNLFRNKLMMLDNFPVFFELDELNKQLQAQGFAQLDLSQPQTEATQSINPPPPEAEAAPGPIPTKI